MKSLPSGLIVTFIVLSGSFPGAGAQTPAEDAPKFRSSADVVTIQASVRTPRGRPVRGLTPSDFEVRDNGQARPILSLRADSHSPVSVAILVDTSGSMGAGLNAQLARHAYECLLSQLHGRRDEAALFSFDSELHEHRPFTSDMTLLRGALEGIELFGSTSLYDAAAAGARRLSARSAAHKALIILTDGVDTSSTLTAEEVSTLAGSIGVPVYVIATVPSLDQRSLTEAVQRRPRANAVDLRNLAEWTGGMLLFATNPTEAMEVATRLLDELRQQYVIAIEAAAVRQWRRLDVRVKRTSAIVKARSGYFGG